MNSRDKRRRDHAQGRGLASLLRGTVFYADTNHASARVNYTPIRAQHHGELFDPPRMTKRHSGTPRLNVPVTDRIASELLTAKHCAAQCRTSTSVGVP